jgi:hypothetical protein
LKNKDLGPLAQAAGLIDKRLRAAIVKRESDLIEQKAEWDRFIDRYRPHERVTKAELAAMPVSGVTH